MRHLEKINPYNEFIPRIELAPYIECFWVFNWPKNMKKPYLHTVVPDQCSDIIFDVGSVRHDDYDLKGTMFVGVMTRSIEVTLKPGNCLMGIRFKPYGAVCFLKHNSANIRDRIVSADILNLKDFFIKKKLVTIKEQKERFSFLENFLFNKLNTVNEINKHVEQAVRLISNSKGTISVSAISKRQGISSRHLARIFLENTGLSPKEFMSIQRFQYALQQITNGPEAPDWASLSAELGFHDQAHFIHQFKKIMGKTPGDYFCILKELN